MQILANESLHVAGVPWNVLLSDHVGRSSNPIFCKYTEVSINEFILLLIGDLVLAVHPGSLISHSDFLQHGFVRSLVRQNFSLYLALGSAEPVDLGGNVAGVAWHIVLLEQGGSCNFSHFDNILLISLNNC